MFCRLAWLPQLFPTRHSLLDFVLLFHIKLHDKEGCLASNYCLQYAWPGNSGWGCWAGAWMPLFTSPLLLQHTCLSWLCQTRWAGLTRRAGCSWSICIVWGYPGTPAAVGALPACYGWPSIWNPRSLSSVNEDVVLLLFFVLHPHPPAQLNQLSSCYFPQR